MKKKVLIFNGGNPSGAAIARCINMSVLYEAVSASSYPDFSRFIFENYYSELPFVNEKKFIDELNALVDRFDIEYIMPTHDTLALKLMENEKKINAIIVCSPLETTEICRYKTKTYQVLQEYDFVPNWYTPEQSNSIKKYPLFLKPDDGQGGKGTLKINSPEELKKAENNNVNYVICEYLPGEEYTIDCFTKSTGELIYINPRKRAAIKDGKSSLAESVIEKDEFIKIANIINSKIRFRGYWFIQLKKDTNNNLKLMEICTRFAGTFVHANASGVNLPLLALSDFSGKDVNIVNNDYNVITGKDLIDRYELDMTYNRIYIDYDDTITCDNGTKVNSLILAWLYQCKNSDKEIILISRHTATKNNSLYDDMKRLKISHELFSKIIDIDSNQRKEDYINNDISSIFMDNSFEERRRVSEYCNIPVFDVCHVDCLYDWRKL